MYKCVRIQMCTHPTCWGAEAYCLLQLYTKDTAIKSHTWCVSKDIHHYAKCTSQDKISRSEDVQHLRFAQFNRK